MLQQHLPFTVLKPYKVSTGITFLLPVATAPTVYGIETVLVRDCRHIIKFVATAPTVYGIETALGSNVRYASERLQQHLPFTVLKPKILEFFNVLNQTGCNSTYRLRY